jgi:hypothetical protein
MMKAPEFEMEQRYGIERRRMLNRAIAGWGVVRGLAIRGAHEHESPHREHRQFCVTRGLALDHRGREILLAENAILGPANTFVVGPNCELRSVDRLEQGDYVLAIHYAERLLGDASLPDDCCDTYIEKNYVCETALFSLRREECPCGERECPESCRCHQHRCLCGKRARNSCLCEWTARAGKPDHPKKSCRWREYEVWVEDGVDIACLHISKRAEDCRPPEGCIQDDCGPRRIVKSNDLLYNLIRGCDLTRIACLSWGEWHRSETEVQWEEFVRKLKGEREHHDVFRTGLTVHFTGPVRADTVRPDCFTLQISNADREGWLHTRCVEITRVLTPHHHDDPQGSTREATLCVRPEWIEDLTCNGSRYRRHGAIVQIEVRGDFILDCHHQPVDANARGFALHRRDGEGEPSGNGTPGGVLTSVFKVARAHESRPDYDDRPHLSDEEE